MELCTSHGVFSLQHRCPNASYFRPAPIQSALLPSLPHNSRFRVKSEMRLRTLSLRATSEEPSTGQTEYAKGTRDPDINFEEASSVERITQVQVLEPEKLKEENDPDNQSATFELLDKLDLKIDSDSTFVILLYGGGAIVSLWLASAVVGTIDDIPVFPKLLQIVGLVYTIWFTSRYLIFKESRDELAKKIAELKLKILGSEWN